MPRPTVIQVGTAGWTDRSPAGEGRFYPKGCNSAEQRLRHYASHFPMVEVDSTFYSMPSARNAMLWSERTPPDFCFNLKVFRVFTRHRTPIRALPPALQAALQERMAGRRSVVYGELTDEEREMLWARFEEGVRPLHEAGKLTAVHFQFPPLFLPGEAAFAHIEECAARLRDYRIAVEFRHESWFDDAHRDATLAFERAQGLAHVVVDAPQGVGNSVPQVWEVGDPSLVVVRLHGRNVRGWNARGPRAGFDRFDYDYGDDELPELAAGIRRLVGRVDRIQVVFNNIFEKHGQPNATALHRMLAVP